MGIPKIKKKMKKINFEKLTNDDLFGRLKANKISALTSSQVRAGDDSTSTALCSTTETWTDKDSVHGQEDLDDPRCHPGYQ